MESADTWGVKTTDSTAGRVIGVGDMVTWESQAAGSWKRKEGVVVEVVQPKGRPSPGLVKGAALIGRKEVSYVVRVGNRHYWPRTSSLSLVTSAGSSDSAVLAALTPLLDTLASAVEENRWIDVTPAARALANAWKETR